MQTVQKENEKKKCLFSTFPIPQILVPLWEVRNSELSEQITCIVIHHPVITSFCIISKSKTPGNQRDCP